MSGVTLAAEPERSAQALPQSPYQGPYPFGVEDAKWFFGRDAERRMIISHLRTSRLTLLYAESGVGKTSLLSAGVAARLRTLASDATSQRGSPGFVPVVFRSWNDDPLTGLIQAIATQTAASSAAADTTGRHAATGPPRGPLATALAEAITALRTTVLVILDQFEEYLGSRRDPAQTSRFATELAECINSLELRAHFLIGIREDAYGKVGDFFGGRIVNPYEDYIHLGYLTKAAARAAITEPVRVYAESLPAGQEVRIEQGLADAVLAGVVKGGDPAGSGPLGDRPGLTVNGDGDEIEAPFLQLVMDRLWDWEREHHSNTLRKDTLQLQLGGVKRIVRDHFDRALKALSTEDLKIATHMFKAMVTPSGTKLALSARDLAQSIESDETRIRAILQTLGAQRIVRSVDPAPGSAEERYEIFHDSFTAPIRDLLEAERRKRLEDAARRSRKVALVVGGLLLVAVLAGIAAVLGLISARDARNAARHSRNVATQEKQAAQSSARQATELALTTRAQAQLGARPDVALLLLLAAYRESPSPLAQRTLATTLTSAVDTGAVGVMHGHTDAVETVAFSPGSHTLASGSADHTVRLWRVSGTQHYPLGPPLPEGGPVFSVAFSPDGRTLASGTFDRIVLWNVTSPGLQTTIADPGGAVNSVAYSRDGGLLAAGDADGTALVLNTSNGRRVHLPVSTFRPVTSVAFDPAGGLLAAASGFGVSLWSTRTDREVGSLVGHVGLINAVAFSAGGTTVAAAGNGKIAFWDVATRRPIPPMIRGPGNIFYSLAFGPRGDTLAAGGPGVVDVWNSTTHAPVGSPLAGHHGAVYGVAFSPDGRLLVSAGADRTIRIWRPPIAVRFGRPLLTTGRAIWTTALSPDGRMIAAAGRAGVIQLADALTGRPEGTLAPHSGPIHQVAFDPSRQLLAAAGNNGKITVWNPITRQPVGRPMSVGVRPVFSIAFDPRGDLLVSGDAYRDVRLWSVATHRPLAVLHGHLGAVYAVAFARNGTEFASGGSDRRVFVWSTRARRPLQTIAQDDGVFSLAFAPAGDALAVGGADDTVRIWHATPSGQLVAPVVLVGHSSFVRGLAFSGDGSMLASASSDSTLRLWDAASGQEIGNPLTGNARGVESVVFGRNGAFLVSGGDDGTVREWPAINAPSTFAALRLRVCDFLGAGLSRTEWTQYAQGAGFEQTCPRVTAG